MKLGHRLSDSPKLNFLDTEIHSLQIFFFLHIYKLKIKLLIKKLDIKLLIKLFSNYTSGMLIRKINY